MALAQKKLPSACLPQAPCPPNYPFLQGSALRCPLLRRRTALGRFVASSTSLPQLSRRAALTSLFAAGTAVLGQPRPADAAYGESANVFAPPKGSSTDYREYVGDGYRLLLPSKWNPSKEEDFAGVEVRYEDNFDPASSITVMKMPAKGKGSVEDFGSPQKFMSDHSFLLGQQVWEQENGLEGGFAPGKVSAANVLEADITKDRKGTTYYKLDVLTRTADYAQGGKHHLISAAIKGGELYVLKISIGDKKWFKGSQRVAMDTFDSFSVA